MKVRPSNFANHLLCLASMGFGSSEFLSVVSFFSSQVEFRFHQVGRCNAFSPTKVLVTFHRGFQVGVYSIAKSIFHFIGNALGKYVAGL